MLATEQLVDTLVTHDPSRAAPPFLLGPHGLLTQDSPASEQGGQKAKRALTKAMVQHFSDGEWYALRDIAAFIETDLNAAREFCHRLTRRGVFKTLVERRHASPAQGGWSYRFVKGGKRLSLEAFYAEAGSVLDDMERLIYGHAVDFSQQAMKIAYQRLRQVIDRVAR
jgi:hypothetical protein